MATTTKDPHKKNAVIMGLLTWETIPLDSPLLAKCVVIVLTTNPKLLKENVPRGVLVAGNFNEAIESVDNNLVERIWIAGGTAVYKEAMEHPLCHRIYLTEIQKFYESDTFFPEIDDSFKLLDDHGDETEFVPTEKQTEEGVDYYFRIYEKIK